MSFLSRLRATLGDSAPRDEFDASGAPVVERVVRGIPVVVRNTRPDVDTARVLDRAEAVLALVADHQPWRLRRLARDLAAIEVRRFPCRAAYFPATRTCLLELTFMANPAFTDAQVASSLVHEGVHARVHAMGVRDFPGRMPKEERLCRLAEIDFGLAVPGGEPAVERARAALAMADDEVAPAVDWNLAAQRVADADRRAGG